jgi:dipeptidyl aminopeptidase/acylaminoacyl peptidase
MEAAAMKRAWPVVSVALLALASVGLAGCGDSPSTGAAGLPTSSGVAGLGKVAYVLDGVIYVKDLPDGVATRLIEGSEPRWSPSGEWLIFWSGDSHSLIHMDGSSLRQLPNWPASDDPRVMPCSVAAWSPAEDKLAYVSDGAIFVENADGSGERRVTTLGSCPLGLAWSPDGLRLAYDQQEQIPLSGYSDEGGGKVAPINRRASLWVVDANGSGNSVELYRSTTDGLFAAGWIADGEEVLFWRDIQFSASMMADGLPLEAIAAQAGAQPRELAWGSTAGMSLAPAEGKVAMTVPPGRESWTRKRIVTVEVDSGETHYLTPEDRASIQPAWSSDGTRIAFVSKPDVGAGPGGPGYELETMASDRRIWVMNADGSDQRPLTDDPAYRDEQPLWSADGSQILFARLDGERRASLWLMPSNGGAPQRVVDTIGPSGGGLMGYYTNVGWEAMFDWWRPPVEQESGTFAPTPTAKPPSFSIVVPSPLDPNTTFHPLIRGWTPSGDANKVIVDSGGTLHVGPSEAGLVWRFKPGERWLVSRDDGTLRMSGAVAGEALMYENVYGFVRLDDGGAVAYSYDIGGNWIVYSAQEICASLGQALPIPAAFVVDGVIKQEELLDNMCDGQDNPCRDKMDGVVRGIAVCVEKLGIMDGLRLVP